jgi:GNAT superfamily N-acetyltransferase
MPAMLDDPTSPPIRRIHTSPDFSPTHVTLRDGSTRATILPFTSLSQVPSSLVAFLCTQLALEIEGGDTYPMVEPLPLEAFGPYWFSTFAAVMLLGEHPSTEAIAQMQDADWSHICLGSFYIKPNYPGRSSHVCNGGFLVTPLRRNAGVGSLLARAYLDWAPKLVSGLTSWWFFVKLMDNHRASRTRYSIWFTKLTLRLAESGIH